MSKTFLRIKIVFSHLLYIFFIPLWIFQKLIPRKKNTWIFGAWHGLKFSDNSKAFFLEIAENHPEIEAIWLTRDVNIVNELRSKGFKSYHTNSLRAIFKSLLAKVVIISSSKSDVNPFFINGAKLIQIWHGAPLKKIGMDVNISIERRMLLGIQKYLFPFIYEYTYDYVVSTSECFNDILCSSFLIPKENIINSGYPRNDIFYKEGIVDYMGVMLSMKENIINSGGDIFLNTKIENIEEKKNLIYINKNSSVSYNIIIYTTGLQSDINYKKFTKNKLNAKIVPFRGEYYTLEDHAKRLVNHLVYPVGNPKFPFLGVHFTRMINGDREVGPNAVLAFKREGYKNSDISINDMIDYLGYSGFLKFIGKNLKFCINEFSTSILKSSFLKKTQKLIPEIRDKDIKSGPAGVRAQGIDSSGNLMMDFEVKTHNNQIHVINAPSPAATSALSIADYIIKNYIK